LAAEGAAGHPAEAVVSAALSAAAAVSAAVVRVRAGNEMRTKEFLSKLDHDRIVQAIRDVESKTSAEIRVYIQRGHLSGDALTAAQKRFQKLGMQKTRERHGVLVFVAPRAHKFAVVGDEAIHEKCGETYWQRVVDSMREHFRNERFSDAIVDGIRDIGRVLAEHFPKRSTSSNDLPDEVVEG
jgi:uncharacterized membrane protein